MKQLLSIFFVTLFTTTVIAPSVLAIVDSAADISLLYDASEEEKGENENKELEVVIIINTLESESLITFEIENNLEYAFKTYSIPYLSLILSPPKFI